MCFLHITQIFHCVHIPHWHIPNSITHIPNIYIYWDLLNTPNAPNYFINIWIHFGLETESISLFCCCLVSFSVLWLREGYILYRTWKMPLTLVKILWWIPNTCIYRMKRWDAWVLVLGRLFFHFIHNLVIVSVRVFFLLYDCMYAVVVFKSGSIRVTWMQKQREMKGF